MATINDIVPFIDNIIVFFRDLYNRAVDVILNVTNWIETARQAAFDWAANVANAVFNAAVVFVNDQIKYIKGYILTEVNNVRNWFAGLIDSVLRTVFEFRDAAITFATSLFDKLIAWVNDTIKLVRGEFYTLIAPLADVIAWIKIQGSFLWERLNAFASFLDGLRLSYLIDLLTTMYAFLRAFVSKPFAIILSYWKSQLWRFLQYYLAYQLGTTKEELPKWPEDLV